MFLEKTNLLYKFIWVGVAVAYSATATLAKYDSTYSLGDFPVTLLKTRLKFVILLNPQL